MKSIGRVFYSVHCPVPLSAHAAHWPGSVVVVGVAVEELAYQEAEGVVVAACTFAEGATVLRK